MASPYSNGITTRHVADPANLQVAAIIDGVKWGEGTAGTAVKLTYSFPSGQAAYVNNYGTDNSGEWLDGWSGLGPYQQDRFEAALAEYTAVSRLTFSELPDNQNTVGEIRVAFTSHIDLVNDETFAYTYTLGRYPEAGDIWLARDIPPGYLDFNDLSAGSYGYTTILHELGHALGLKHPFDASPVLPANLDNMFHTVMSYDEDPFGNGYLSDRDPSTLMPLDILAVQYLYGKNWAYHAGNDTYTYYEAGSYLETIWDAGGVDTISYVGSSGGKIDLRNGHFSELGQPVSFQDDFGEFRYDVATTVAIAYGVTIENAVGSDGSDLILGNAVSNRLVGGLGHDLIAGLNGADQLIGGAGRDQLYGGNGTDILIGGDGRDRLDGGPGADALNGGKGVDSFIFNYPLGDSNVDRVFLFVSGEDILKLDDDVFTALATPAGALLAASEFVANTTGRAVGLDDHIIYNTGTGELFYDADGSGAGGAQMFAVLVDAPDLAATDIFVTA